MSKTSKNSIDKVFLGIVVALVIFGLISFVSASLGILAKNEEKFYGVLFNQLVLGLLGGSIALLICMKYKYDFWRNNSFIIFLGSIVLTLLVFVPGLGLSHGGARRWISIFGFSLQPVEFLKIGFVIYFAAYLSWIKSKVSDYKFSILPLILMIGVIASVLLAQPDTKSLMLIIAVGASMLFVSGIPIKYIVFLISIAAAGLIALAMFTPYLTERIETFLDPSSDPSNSSYQLQQSLIAIGSGGVFGRGLGQSIQKFSYLPEPQGDSIFAVIGEEFGFVGSVLLLVLYVAFVMRGLHLAYRAPDSFSRLFIVGIVILFGAQSLLNIASIVGLFPLTGVPLVFISHGGTSLLISLAAIGIILNMSKYQRKIN
ncbi:putative lipid II flippase FtsW [Candidatus Nomurabacteria bacterium]|nr:MAG: putative lipid II flippase FtsW [Candidatus Nomurabacteria bacterium]